MEAIATTINQQKQLANNKARTLDERLTKAAGALGSQPREPDGLALEAAPDPTNDVHISEGEQSNLTEVASGALASSSCQHPANAHGSNI